MKAVININLKDGVLDPQGQTIAATLQNMGFTDVTDARQGKTITINISDSVDRNTVMASLEEMCRNLLVNPVIETYSITLND